MSKRIFFILTVYNFISTFWYIKCWIKFPLPDGLVLIFFPKTAEIQPFPAAKFEKD